MQNFSEFQCRAQTDWQHFTPPMQDALRDKEVESPEDKDRSGSPKCKKATETGANKTSWAALLGGEGAKSSASLPVAFENSVNSSRKVLASK